VPPPDLARRRPADILLRPTSIPAGATSFDVTHQYADDNPSGTASDTYPVTMSLVDDDGAVATANSGAVIIDGGDRDEHGSSSIAGTTITNLNGWKYIEQMVAFANANVRNGNAGKLLVIGATGSTATPTALNALNAITKVKDKLGLNMTVITGLAIDTVNFDDYGILYVPSDLSDCAGGVSTPDLIKLAARKTAIQTFNRDGGSIVALTEAAVPTSPGPYAWLALPDPFTIAGGTINSTQYKTQALLDSGLVITETELLNGTPLHNTFTGPVGFNGLVPFVYSVGTNGVNNNGGGDDRVVTLGLASGAVGLGLSVKVNNVSPTYDAGPNESLPSSAAGLLTRGPISFADPGTDVWSGTVNYGDGTGNQVLPIDQLNKTFTLNHTYTTQNNFTVSISRMTMALL
jgi:hypothetical protein